jgi:hypothetical protein
VPAHVGAPAIFRRPNRRSGAVFGPASAIIADPRAEADLTLKAASTLATAGAVYLRILEGSELQARIEALEEIVHRRNGHG